MNHIRYKRGVLGYWNEVLEQIDEAFLSASRQIMGVNFIPFCSSVLEGNHSYDPESGHYQARSKDFGTHGFLWIDEQEVPVKIPEEKWEELATLLQAFLNEKHGVGIYYVKLERNPSHFHIQRNKNTL